MEELTVGSVVLVKFPFSDLKNQKIRPALVVAKAELDDLIVCQITSKPYSVKKLVEISPDDFAKGNLPVLSYARPEKLFTLNKSLIIDSLALLNSHKTNQVLIELQLIFGRLEKTRTNNT